MATQSGLTTLSTTDDPPPAGSSRQATYRLLWVATQLAGLLLLIRAFEIESRAFYSLACLAFGGFVVHALLPARHQLRFFGLLSVASLFVVLGPVAGALTLGIGLMLIGICHLPIRFSLRMLALLVLGSVLIWGRGHVSGWRELGAVWPVLASMFVFRIALYAYSLRHRDAPFSLEWALAYFFMLPNVCFALFPIVDYKTFVRTRFDGERFAIYERGVQWMLRGIVHLMLYRVVYYNLVLGELYVNDLTDLVRQVVATFFLYLKVSGIFHLAVGMLYLYGFRLPETHHLYFLSSSFTDFWRRINIYWKDFMMKLVYYPSFFRLRKLGNRTALYGATALVFIVTWALHGVQFYFVRGEGLFSRRDVAFWGLFAVLVLATTWWESREGRVRQAKRPGWSARRGAATVATFVAIAILWSLWNAESFRTWVFMYSRAQYASVGSVALVIGLAGAAFVLTGFSWGSDKLAAFPSAPAPVAAYGRRASARLAFMLGVGVLALPAVSKNLTPDVGAVVANLHGVGLPIVGEAGANIGYYESLQPSSADARGEWHLARAKPEARFDTTAMYTPRDGFLLDGLRPDVHTTFLGKPFTTNRWGFRGRDYALEKPAGVYRIALLGASDVMGWGVGDNETFGAVLEASLDSSAARSGRRVEVLNFGMSAYSLPQRAYVAQELAMKFKPDLILLSAEAYELPFYRFELERVFERHTPIPDAKLASIIEHGDVNHSAKGIDLLREIRPLSPAMTTRVLAWVSEMARPAGAAVAVISLKLPEQRGDGTLERLRGYVADAGLPLLDCADVWHGRNPESLSVGGADLHPNAAGHRLIAGCVEEKLRLNAAYARLPVGPANSIAASMASITSRQHLQ
ncbi:MAG TPA: hypothetical protein VE967_17010 [Gemmatimonadaceae bacterium]|nr:hypothetical protein [Gemmatimonadaceae bacterium]